MLRFPRQFLAPELRGCRNILLVSHERHIARLVEVNLERAGKTVFVAYSLPEARALLHEPAGQRIHGVLVDAEMVTGPSDSVTVFQEEARQAAGVRFVQAFGRPAFPATT